MHRSTNLKSFFQTRQTYGIPAIRRDFRAIWRSTTLFLNRNRRICLAVVAVTLGVAWWLALTNDHALIKAVWSKRSPELNSFSGALSYWGDFAQYNLGLAATIWAAGFWLRSRWLQRLAVATVMAATLAGLTCNIFRFSLSRPRPQAKATDGLYGFRGAVQGWNYHSFPSGHTSTAFGTSTPLLVAGGPVGAVVTVFSASVAWSRIYRGQHFPSDVLVGAMLGVLYGVAAASGLRELRRRSSRMAYLRRCRASKVQESTSSA